MLKTPSVDKNRTTHWLIRLSLWLLETGTCLFLSSELRTSLIQESAGTFDSNPSPEIPFTSASSVHNITVNYDLDIEVRALLLNFLLEQMISLLEKNQNAERFDIWFFGQCLGNL